MIFHKPVNPNELSILNSRSEFCIYNRDADRNILFLGSCRHSVLMYYYSLLNPDINIYCIYTPFWTEDLRKNFPIDKINQILSSTDIIVTETIKSYGILNTYRENTNNFFNIFDAKKVSEVRIPNLHLSLYAYDLIHLCNKKPDQFYDTFMQSMQRLKKSIYNKKFNCLYDFISTYFQDIRMFYTLNHPSKIVCMLLFKLLAQQLNIDIPKKFFYDVKKYNFLEGHCTPITHFDIDIHKFTFCKNIFDNSILKQKNFIYRPEIELLDVSNNDIDIIYNID